MHVNKSVRRRGSLAVLSAAVVALTACGSGSADGTDDEITVDFSNSYPDSHPHNECGTQVVKEKVESQDVGLGIEIYPSSQLGADADRFTSLSSGDLDMDLQGSSALSTAYEPIGVLDMFYAFDGPDQLFEWFDSEAADQVKSDFEAETGAKVLDAWFFGMRVFSANEPIREPADLEGLRIRFPDSPAYLASAEAVGAEATSVAYEEIYLSLQQGIVDGQENPVSTIEAESFDEVQDYVSLSDHQTGAQLVVISSETWDQLSTEQQEVLETAVRETRAEDRQCIEDAREQILADWEETGEVEVVADVNRDAFAEMAEEYFLNNLEGGQLELYTSIGHG